MRDHTQCCYRMSYRLRWTMATTIILMMLMRIHVVQSMTSLNDILVVSTFNNNNKFRNSRISSSNSVLFSSFSSIFGVRSQRQRYQQQRSDDCQKTTTTKTITNTKNKLVATSIKPIAASSTRVDTSDIEHKVSTPARVQRAVATDERFVPKTAITTTTRKPPTLKPRMIRSSAPNPNRLSLSFHSRRRRQFALSQIPRGGARISDDDDDDEIEDEDSDEEEDEDDDEMLFDDDDDALLFDDDTNNLDNWMDDTTMMTDSDFAEGNMLNRMLDAWNYKTPPITKFYLSCSFLVTLYAYLWNKNEFPALLLLDWKLIATRGQIWRLVTSFFNFGPAGLGYLMTCQFIWVYMSTLERLNYQRPYDFMIMILFGQFSMIIGYPLLRLSPKFLGHNLSTYLVYIWSRYHEGIEVNMFELFNARAEMLPWFFLLQTFLLEGEIPILDFLGIVFGHIYHHYYTVGVLRAPQSLVNWYEHSSSQVATYIRELYKPVSADFDVGAQ